jgi:hypothetical protein
LKQVGDDRRSHLASIQFNQRLTLSERQPQSMVDIARYGDASNACMLLAEMRRHSDQAGIRNKARCRQSEQPT